MTITLALIGLFIIALLIAACIQLRAILIGMTGLANAMQRLLQHTKKPARKEPTHAR
jgi:hypothetical protein